MNDKFALKELCKTCSHTSCCTGFDSPFLFENDVKNLIKIGKSKFIEEIKVANLKVKSIKKKPDSTNCVFWDEVKKTCEIYENRPFDCRMFPFDIMKVKGEIVWILFSCNSESNWEWTEEHLKKLEEDPNFQVIMKNMDIFQHTLETEFSKEHHLPYTVLRKVNCKR